jgi:ABC-type polysaccharide/polyol phosphate transport system ATPase subunit
MFDIRLDHVSKRYSIRSNSRARSIGWPQFSRKEDLWALRDISFEVLEGESLGIIGNNGAGKSTLLKLLAKITTPTLGEIRIRGRLSALIEVGSGFHPELTGRENIFLNGSMLGMTRSEIARKVESVVEFAGVSEHIDVPVKRYSSGMYVRLGFSIAAHLDPDILLLDEVLAVGDIVFQAKCLDLVSQMREAGRTIILISHDLAAIHRVCDRAIFLHHGQVAMTGSPTDVIDRYQQMAMGGEETYHLSENSLQEPAACSYIRFGSTEPNENPRTGYPMITRMGFLSQQDLENVAFNVLIYWPSGYLCAQLTTSVSNPQLQIKKGAGEVEFCCPVLEIQPGWYRVDISIESNGNCIDRQQHCAVLRVHPGKIVLGDFYIDTAWRILTKDCHAENQENVFEK